jgi:hypothetical protein
MIRLRVAALGVVLWCAVVVAASSLVWVVISRAGSGVVPITQPEADVTGSLVVPGHDRSSGGRPTPGVTLSPHPSSPSSPSSSGGTPSGGPTGSPVLPPPSTSSTADTPAAERRSWSGAAGHVVVECRGPVEHLVAAYPNAGWRYVIGSRGPGLVQVRFVRVGQEGRSVTVQARCVSGVPHVTLPTHEAGDT